MATAYITEFANLALTPIGVAQVAQWPALAKQTVAIGAEAKSSAFNAKTRFIRVEVDAICSFDIATTPTATTAMSRMAADGVEYFGVNPSDKISFISNT